MVIIILNYYIGWKLAYLICFSEIWGGKFYKSEIGPLANHKCVIYQTNSTELIIIIIINCEVCDSHRVNFFSFVILIAKWAMTYLTICHNHRISSQLMHSCCELWSLFHGFFPRSRPTFRFLYFRIKKNMYFFLWKSYKIHIPFNLTI